MDSVDRQILAALQAEGRRSNADIARDLGMVTSAIHQRVRRLEEAGVLVGYAARLDPRAVECGLLAFVHVRTDEQLDSLDVGQAMARLPAVLEVHDIAGEDCYLLKVRATDTKTLHTFLRRTLGTVPGVRSTSTTIVLDTISEHTRLPLSDLSSPSDLNS